MKKADLSKEVKMDFEEWKVSILPPKETTTANESDWYSKVEKIRDVKITDAQSHVLNTGKINNSNTVANMFFLPGSNTYYVLECGVIS